MTEYDDTPTDSGVDEWAEWPERYTESIRAAYVAEEIDRDAFRRGVDAVDRAADRDRRAGCLTYLLDECGVPRGRLTPESDQ